MSKDLFLQMREQEIITDNFLPKKAEIKQASLQFAKDLVEHGETNLYELFAQAVRMKEALITIEAELKNSLPQENFESFGLKGTFKNGGDMPQFTDDPIYAEKKAELKEREDLLKVALKSSNEIYDETGVEVPKVSTKPRKSSLTINY